MSKKFTLFTVAMIGALLFSGCQPDSSGDEGNIKVLATTSIVADVVQQVAGVHVRVETLLPVGTDPHTFEPRPQDAAALADADLVFANGAGLEEFLQPLLESSGAADKLVEVSDGIVLLPFSGDPDHAGGDPHTWMDPNNVLVWVTNIQAALSALDPAHAEAYRAYAEAYSASLVELDAWIQAEVDQVPAANRDLVSDHAVFGYFAERYGFTQAGTITGSFSSGAAPSAQELAALEDAIRDGGVRAIFVGKLDNNELANRVSADTGIPVVGLYHGTLSQPGGEADTYLKLMRYNVSAIVEALK